MLGGVVWWKQDLHDPNTMKLRFRYGGQETDYQDESGTSSVLLLDQVRCLVYWRFVLGKSDLPGETAGNGEFTGEVITPRPITPTFGYTKEKLRRTR